MHNGEISPEEFDRLSLLLRPPTERTPEDSSPMDTSPSPFTGQHPVDMSWPPWPGNDMARCGASFSLPEAAAGDSAVAALLQSWARRCTRMYQYSRIAWMHLQCTCPLSQSGWPTAYLMSRSLQVLYASPHLP